MLSPEVTAGKEPADVDDVVLGTADSGLATVLDCTSIASIVTLCRVTVVVSEGGVVMLNVVVVVSDSFLVSIGASIGIIEPVVDVGSSGVVAEESSVLTVTFASCSILERSKP